MTRNQWRASLDPMSMLAAVAGKASDRKLRLFACACCRCYWHVFDNGGVSGAIKVVEGWVDGLLTRRAFDELPNYVHRALLAAEGLQQTTLSAAHGLIASDAYEGVVWITHVLVERNERLHRDFEPRLYFAQYLRCIFSHFFPRLPSQDLTVTDLVTGLLRVIGGSPHGAAPVPEVPLEPVIDIPDEWRTSTAIGLASAVYVDRAFDRMPILADALEDAGCDDADILAHCRGPGPHVRGCWVVDLVLGKS